MLLLTLLTTQAFALDTYDTVEVSQALRDLQLRHGEIILVGAAGPSAQEAVDGILGAAPPAQFEVVRVPTVGQRAAEAELKLNASPATCMAWVGTFGAELTLETFGACPPLMIGPSPPPVTWAEPATQPPGAGAASAPQPFVASPTPAQWQQQQRELLALEASLPDPTTALLMSSAVGFGAGHFYSGNEELGRAHLALQLSGLAVAGLGGAVSLSNPEMGRAVMAAGSLTFTASRLVDIATAPRSAHERAENMARRGR